MSFDDPVLAYRLAAISVSIGIVGMTLRHLLNWRWYRPDGLYPWSIAGNRSGSAAARFARVLLDHPGFTVILGLRAGSAAWTFVSAFQGATDPVAVSLLLITSLVKKWRLRVISEEAEVMLGVVLVPLACHAWRPGDAIVAIAGLWFITAQVCLAYLGAGSSKLRSSAWRDGTALSRIFTGSIVKNRWIAENLAARPRLARLLCHATIGVQLAFPLALIAPPPLLVVILAAGALFHLAIAVMFGLGTFLWAFIAAYPAVVFTHRQIAQLIW